MGPTSSISGDEARHELYALLHQIPPRKQALERVIEIGTSYLGIEHSHITDIDRAEGRWDVISSSDGPDGPYPEGLSADLNDSYCRQTIEQTSPIALHDAGNQGWADDHAYQLHQLETYIGLRIQVFDELFGTLCFVERDARPEPFTEAERIFVELAGEVLRQVLERSYHQKQLANRDRLISVLNRVLRHNLRNDLNVVHGYAEMIESRSTGEVATWAEIIEETTTDLLELGEKARRLEHLTRSVPVSRPMDIVPVVDHGIDSMRQRDPTIDITYEAPEEAVALAAPQLAEAVIELLENAVNAVDEAPSIDVSIDQTPSTATVSIADEGPGLPPDEQRVLTQGDETQLEHGSGLGLALVFWILTNMDAEITVEASGAGTTIYLGFEKPSAITSLSDPTAE